YVPVYYNPFKDEEPVNLHKLTLESDYSCDMEIDIVYNDSNNVLNTIVPGLYLSDHARLYCKYSSISDQYEIWLKSVDTLAYGSVVASHLQLGVYAKKDKANAGGIIHELSYGSAFSLKNMWLDINSNSSDAKLKMGWDDKEKVPTSGLLNIVMHSTPQQNNVKIDNSSFTIKGEKWQVADRNEIIYGDKLLDIRGLQIKSDQQSLLVNGYVSPDSSDAIDVDFNKFDVGFFNIFLNDIGLSMAGSLNGTISIKDFYKTINYAANMRVSEWKINDRDMGDAKLLSRWEAEKRRIGVVLESSLKTNDTTIRKPLAMKCYYYPEDDGKLQGDATFNGFDLKSVAPYLESFSSRFEGGLHGDIAIGGTLSKPRITGDAIFEDGLIKIDMFNTLYRFSDTVFFEDNKILINDFVINDLRDNSAVVNGIVIHNSFKNFAVDLSLVSDNFMVMNTSSRDNDLFYGTVFANVNGTVKGPVNNLVVAANATTNKGSSFAIQLSDKQQISEQNFIRFTQKERTRSTVRRQTQSNMKYRVLVNIAANSNVKFSMPMDFSQLTALVSATGNGNLQLSIASGSPFSLSGDYIIESGAFKINLMDLVSRELALENGSSLRWSGSPTDANIDIKGIYAQRVNLATLYAGSSSMEQHTSKTVNVESIIALSGQLMNPTIKFDFRLPNADQSTEEEVFAVIDRSNEREMINQTVSLLAMNSFYSSTSNATDNFNTMSTGLGIVANQVSSVVSSMVEFVDVNINYKSGDALVTNQLDIDISKEWNRFYFETTFGFGGDARTLNQLDNGRANTIIGDVLLGYKISPNFHLVAFNRSNANDYTKQDMPYTQGVGIKYSKDFDTWESLFSRKKKAKKTATADKGKKK
ncbi:MAG: translocation/assembly module TamB domain-containing protein, partial [Bacteroidales bacterium]|nr:translocation/assembly module TamB domain-containing protein [Bacteroidales bacterium]